MRVWRKVSRYDNGGGWSVCGLSVYGWSVSSGWRVSSGDDGRHGAKGCRGASER